jgi:ChrR Cupin-like domain
MSTFDRDRCEQNEVTCALQECQRELESLRLVVDRFVSWPTDVLRPTTSLQGRLALRITEEMGKQPVLAPERQWSEPDWEQVAPGIECKLLATDTEWRRVSMLVRLAPGASYPAHTHAGVEELHLLDGELWIDQRKLVPGDYNYGAPGAGDEHDWSETGCTCVLSPAPKISFAEALRRAGPHGSGFGPRNEDAAGRVKGACFVPPPHLGSIQALGVDVWWV